MFRTIIVESTGMKSPITATLGHYFERNTFFPTQAKVDDLVNVLYSSSAVTSHFLDLLCVSEPSLTEVGNLEK